MIAYYWRALDGDDDQSGYFGLVFACNKEELFWLLDEFIDPYRVEIKTAHSGGYCEYQKVTIEKNGDYPEIDRSKTERAGCTPSLDDGGWRKPNWDGVA